MLNSDKDKLAIALVGSFDNENFGDLLFPEIAKHYLEDFDVILFSPKGGVKPFSQNEKVYKVEELEKICLNKNIQAILIGGGDLIRTDNNVLSLYDNDVKSSYLLWQWPIIVAYKLHLPIFFNAPGVPFDFADNQKKIINHVLKPINYLNVRDPNSKNILHNCRLNNVSIIPDTALSVDSVINGKTLEHTFANLIKNTYLPRLDKYLVFQCNGSMIDNDDELHAMRSLMEYVIDKYNYKIVLMPIGYVHSDQDFLNKLDFDNKNIFFVDKKLSPIDMMSILYFSKGYIGSSLHGAIVSCAFNKHFISINTKNLSKINGFLSLINCPSRQFVSFGNMPAVFDKEFFIDCTERVKELKFCINNHFKTIKNGIKNSKYVVNEPNYFQDIQIASFDDLPKTSNFILDNATVYFDEGNDFCEKHSFKVPIVKDKDYYNIVIDNTKCVERLRIDIIEDSYLVISDLRLFDENNNLITNYQIPHSFKISKEESLFLTLDPQIILEGINSRVIKLRLKSRPFCLEDISLANRKLIDELDSVSVELNSIKKKYKYTFTYLIDKLYHAFKK